MTNPWAPESLLGALFDEAPIGLCVVDRELRYVRINEAMAAHNRVPVHEHLGRRMPEVMPELTTDLEPLVRRILETGEPVRAHELCVRLRRDAFRPIWFLGSGYPVRSETGEIIGVGIVAVDITVRKAAEEALAESNARFRQLADNIPAIFWLAELDPPKMVYLSPAFEEIWGRSAQSLMDDPSGFLRAVHPDDRTRVRAVAKDLPTIGYDIEYRMLRPDGETRWIRDRGFPIRDEDGRVRRAAGIASDVTEQKRLEDQLLQAGKMESLGRLAGGVAHDFNNLMTAILGHAAFVAAALPASHEAREDLAQIEDAARRASGLTRQLLAFARRQVIEPRLVDVNDLVANLDALLRRLIGEDIELATLLGPEAHCVRADPSQLEQVLVNLAVNARDAMPAGGKLVLETHSVSLMEGDPSLLLPPGRWVRISVCDTGQGIAPAVRAHLFEPFFTTKEPGKGTGLGLATCYGIVEQCGGHIFVDSRPGAGARFDVFLPQVEGAPVRARASAPSSPPRGSETVLLVEDEPLVREVAARTLRAQGYAVIEAGDGGEALARARAHSSPIHLLVADVVMPRMGGVELAERLRAERPDTRVLHVSGYLERSLPTTPKPPAGTAFLQKPFLPEQLARKVRAVLEGSDD